MYVTRNPVFDLKVQVLTQILSQKREAIDLHNRGYSWYALETLYTLSNDLVLEDDEYEKIDEIMKIRDKIIKDVFKEETLDCLNATTRTNRILRKAHERTKPVFPRVLREINKILKEAKYYQFMMKGGGPATKKDDTLNRLLGEGDL